MASDKEKHWGEWEDSNEDSWGDHNFTTVDIEELLVPQVYPPSTTSLHQPSAQLTPNFQILNGDFCKSDVTVQNTTRLLQHTRHVSHLINRAMSMSTAGSNGTSGDVPTTNLPACPAFPTELPSSRTPVTFHALNFLAPQSTPFTAGQGGGVLQEFDRCTARKMLRQAVALMLVHAGFTETTEAVLRTVTDLLDEFMIKMTKLHRNNMDNAIVQNNYCSFHDVFEQTLQQLHLGGLLDLQRMYRDKVQTYHNTVKTNAIHLTNHYNNMIAKQQSSAGASVASNIGVSQQSNLISQQQQSAWPVTSSTTVVSAAGGNINITIGAPLAIGKPISYPNLTAGNTVDDAVEVLPRATIRPSRTGSVSSSSRPDSNSSNIISLEQEFDRHYTPVNIQSGEMEGGSQNSPLSAHFTINPR